MEKKGISQEGLKLLACVTMLIDHIAASGLVHSINMRLVGRIAFPIYCFLLAEGVHYTKNPKKYGLRLLIGVALSELPFDLVFSGVPNWVDNSVMITLLLGFLALMAMKQVPKQWQKILISLPFIAMGNMLFTDYGSWGVAMVVMFGLVRGQAGEPWLRAVGLLLVCAAMNSAWVRVFGIRMRSELFGMLALIPISFYQGRKATKSAAVQWAFYLFYPVHLAVIWVVKMALG